MDKWMTLVTDVIKSHHVLITILLLWSAALTVATIAALTKSRRRKDDKEKEVPAVKLCADCRHCVKRGANSSAGWECTAAFIDPVDGHEVQFGQSMAPWMARDRYCGRTGIYHEPKQTTDEAV